MVDDVIEVIEVILSAVGAFILLEGLLFAFSRMIYRERCRTNSLDCTFAVLILTVILSMYFVPILFVALQIAWN